ncbi:hypothetical protein ACFE04_008529 [Oxalis oulophora]
METPVRQWNVHLINNIFKADVALAIKSIPFVQGDVKDQWVWNETSSGVYSVKSGYQNACKILYHSAPKSASMVQFSKPLGSLKKSASYHLPEIGSIVETSGNFKGEIIRACCGSSGLVESILHAETGAVWQAVSLALRLGFPSILIETDCLELIYNEQIGDLLDPGQRNLEIKNDPKSGLYVENLIEEYVTSYGDITQMLIKGLSSRKVEATSTNSKSSRSHIVFTFVIESWCKIEVFCSIRHPNMVLPLGACPQYGCLLFQQMNRGTLYDRLFRRVKSPPFSRQQRFALIVAEIAIALLLLHQTKQEPLVYSDLEPFISSARLLMLGLQDWFLL